jgi:quercetin dioxygenase-like cupin family protein
VLRRIVTANDARSRSYVVKDGEPPARHHFGASVATVIWRLTADDVPDPRVADTTGDVEFGLDLAAGESRWVCIEFGPGSEVERHVSATVDLGYVVDGEITLVLDEAEVALRAGDFLVQLGAHHAWRNDGAGPCRIVFHVVSTHPDHSTSDSSQPAFYTSGEIS